jgi:dienelactone hydrolase
MRAPVAVASVRSIVLSAPKRGDDLQLRISAPVEGADLPVILFSHGFGSSMDGYAPLTDYWAAHGFVVVQPTYLDSRRMGLGEDDPRQASIWRIRVDDAKLALDHLERLEGALPGLTGRVDRSRVAAAGHSFGGHTTAMLLGARTIGAAGDDGEDLSDPRISAGVLLAAGGRGGKDLSAFATEHLPYLNVDFSPLKVPTLVVAGDSDRSPLTVRGPDWFYDPYYLSEAAKGLLTLTGGEHMLGGISGYAVAETTDESLERVDLVQRMTWAFLRSTLLVGDPAWRDACQTLVDEPNPQGHVVWK